MHLLISFCFLVTCNIFSMQLSQAVTHAINKNTDIQIAALNKEKALSGQTAAWSVFLPSVLQKASAAKSRSHVLSPSTISTMEQKNYEIQVIQPLFNRSNQVQIHQANTQLSISKAQYTLMQQNLLAQVTSAYLDLVYLVEANAFLTAKNKELLSNVDVMKSKVESGLVNKNQLLIAKTAQLRTEADIIANKKNINAAKLHLETLIQHPIHSVYSLKEDVMDRQNSPQHYTLQNNLELYIAELITQSAQDNHQLALADFVPSVSVNTFFQKNTNNPSSEQAPSQKEYGYSISISSNLSPSRYFNAQTALKAVQVAKKQSVLQNQRQSNLLENLIHDEKSIHSSIVAQKLAVISAQESLKTTKESFLQGNTNILDMLESTSKLFETQAQLESDKIAYINTWIQLQKTIGKLNMQTLSPVLSAFSSRRIDLKSF